jgi:site-specific DNA-methyltransferase (adenine-specific)
MLKLATELEQKWLKQAASKKPKVKKFKDGIVINGEFGSPEVAKILEPYLQKLNLAISDPPYGVLSKTEADWDQGITANDYMRWTKDIQKYLCKGGSAYIWGGIGTPHDRIFFEWLSKVEDETGMTLKNLITWKKKRGFGTAFNYLFVREECAWLINNDTGKPKIFNIPLLDQERGYAGFNPKYPAKSKYLRRTNVWTDINELFQGKTHIAEKPEKLAEIMIETHTRKGDTIMDPFAGSGSSGSAARNLGRRFILIERDPKNFDIICNRLSKEKPKKKEASVAEETWLWEVEKVASRFQTKLMVE